MNVSRIPNFIKSNDFLKSFLPWPSRTISSFMALAVFLSDNIFSLQEKSEIRTKYHAYSLSSLGGCDDPNPFFGDTHRRAAGWTLTVSNYLHGINPEIQIQPSFISLKSAETLFHKRLFEWPACYMNQFSKFRFALSSPPRRNQSPFQCL